MGRQISAPLLVVLIADGFVFSAEQVDGFSDSLGSIKLEMLQNRRAPGAAGAWNMGLDFLRAMGFDGFVAILDDDDSWDSDHLAENLIAATVTDANVVVSGLRLVHDGVLFARSLPHGLTDRMFLVGNPGWQGSNTFVSLRALSEVGGFRDGLASSNDRDLAVRLLRWPTVRIAYTNKWTATWHLSSQRPTLSSPRSKTKCQGLQWFWHIYGGEMTPEDAEVFFARARGLFQIEREEIINATNGFPPHCEARGDWRC